MSGDLFTLRMVVIGDERQHGEVWREAAGLASVPIECVETNGAGAGPLLGKGSHDIVLLDGDVGKRDALIKAARALTPRPIIVLTSSWPGKVEGADVVVQRPKQLDEACKHVERCVNMRMPKRVMVVDDSSTMRSIVRKILSACRYVLEVSEAEEGIAALKSVDGGIDLVLLDCNMPGLNGFETLAEIKRVAPQVNVVMMTSTEDDALVAKAAMSGAAGFLKKPFYPHDIDALLDMIYERSRRR